MAFSLNFICFCILFTTRRSFQRGWQSQNCFCSRTVLMRRYASHLRFDSGWSLLCLSFLLPQSPAPPSFPSSSPFSHPPPYPERPSNRVTDRAKTHGRLNSFRAWGTLSRTTGHILYTLGISFKVLFGHSINANCRRQW